jgi:hypothetical protein
MRRPRRSIAGLTTVELAPAPGDPMRRSVVIGIASSSLLLLAIGCGLSAPPRERALTILRGATTVEVFRVASQSTGPTKGESVGGYPITNRGGDRDGRFAARLAATLEELWRSDRHAAKGCTFEPGVAFRVRRGGESLELVLCFRCDMQHVVLKDRRGETTFDQVEDNDPIRAELVLLAKEVFPADREIQGLPERR